MVTLTLTDEQVMEIVRQLPPSQQDAVLDYLLRRRWTELRAYGEERAREVAQRRGRDWDTMTEQEREDFVDDLVHEDRHCVA
jgi:hypothetical protein